MATIYIDNKPYTVEEGQNLLHACLSLGFNIPYFCWHPAMGSIGACRQCAVKMFRDEKDTEGSIVMSCMTPVAEGARISIDDPEVVDFRARVIEWMMVNHPHDCPVCDEGGECHLQDMTVMTGHIYRKYRGRKRTFYNQYLGPFINHEMNRCIQCYRCVRFYRDFAGGRDFDVMGSRNTTYYGRFEDGALENEFSGNLVEICPTGVFTDKTLKRHYSRKWDLQTAPSVCAHCGLGCNTIPGQREGKLRRIYNRYHEDVNGYFLCDRGRFGYEFVNSNRRITSPMVRDPEGDSLRQAAVEEMSERFKSLFYFGAKVIAIGSPRASLEANYALRTLVGRENFYQGISESESLLLEQIARTMHRGLAHTPSLHEVEKCDGVFILGEDVTNTAPLLALALRQSVRQKPLRRASKVKIPEWQDHSVRDLLQDERGPLFVASTSATKLDEIATGTYHATPQDVARLGFAVANAIDGDSPSVDSLGGEEKTLAGNIASSLLDSARPLIVTGAGCMSRDIIHAAAQVANALSRKGKRPELLFTVAECNSLGLTLLGGQPLESAFKKMKEGDEYTVIILENELYRRHIKEQIDKFLAKAEHVVVLDSIFGATARKADTLLASATFAESDGTLVNNEGRAQRYFKVFGPSADVAESWRWVLRMMSAAGLPESEEWKLFEDITKSMADSVPVFSKIPVSQPSADFRISGLKIPRQPHRYTGRTSIHTDMNVHEPKVPEDHDSPLSYSMEGYEGIPPSSLISRYWAGGWNSVQALNKFQREVAGPLMGGNPGVRLIETAVTDMPAYYTEIPEAFRRQHGLWLIVPCYHIFGSDEMSALSPGIIELCPRPYLGLSEEDMRTLELEPGQEAEFDSGHSTLTFPVRQIAGLRPGVAAIPTGVPGLEGIFPPLLSPIRNGKLKVSP
jgi:NADH-quinone oxidoreductase subunit G